MLLDNLGKDGEEMIISNDHLMEDSEIDKAKELEN